MGIHHWRQFYRDVYILDIYAKHDLWPRIRDYCRGHDAHCHDTAGRSSCVQFGLSRRLAGWNKRTGYPATHFPTPLPSVRIAFEVGYESASQFNREYRRLFGLPPMRDIKARQLVEFEQN